MTREELARILDALPEPRRPLFELLAASGLRISEALGLDWEDLEFGVPDTVLHVRRQFYRCHWLGHSDPSFTLRTYIHMLDAGLGGADFMDRAVGASVLETAPPIDSATPPYERRARAVSVR